MLTDVMPAASTVLTAVILLPLLYYASVFVAYVRNVRRMGKLIDKFPGPPKHWLYGNLHQGAGPGEKGINFYRTMAAKYGPVYRVWVGPAKPGLIVGRYDTIRTMMSFTEAKPSAYRMLEPWLGDGLLVSHGSKWFRNRKLLTPAFHFDILKPFLKIYNEAVDVFMNQIERASEEMRSVEICRPVSLCTLDVILRCAMSCDMDVQQQGESSPYVNAVVNIAKKILDRFFTPHHHPDLIYYMTSKGREFRRMVNLAQEVSTRAIAQRRKALKENSSDTCIKKKYPDFLDILLLARDEDGKGLSDAEIRDEVDNFLFAGHDTTASAISWILYELAKNTDHQEICRQEVASLLAGRSDKDIIWEDLHAAPHLALCIKEAMRLHCPSPVIQREATTEFTMNGLTVPEGTEISLPFYIPHWDSAIWGEDVMEFRPERFHHEHVKDMDPFAYIPFSAGSRNCIGQNFAMNEIKVIASKVLQRFDMEVDPAHHVEHNPELVMRAAGGIKLLFNLRQ